MKFKIQQDLLLSTLNIVNRGLSTKTPMPILTGIYVKVETDKVLFITTNREISIQVVVEPSDKLEIYETGDTVIPGKFFVEIIKKIENEEIEISVFDETTIKIITERSQFTLNALDKSSFPKFNFEPTLDPIILDSSTLKKVITQTSFAASVTESRIVLTGVRLSVKGNRMVATATDSFRLAQKAIDLQNDYPETQMNIPSKSIDELCKIIDDKKDEILLFVLNNKVLIKYQNISFITRLIEGKYPETDSLFTSKYNLEMKFNKNQLLAAIDRASLLSANEALNIVKMVVKSDKKIQILSSSTEIGNVEEDVYPLFISEPSQFQVAFSAKHFIEALKSFDSSEIILHFNGEIKPFTITSEQDSDLTQLILPVRLFN